MQKSIAILDLPPLTQNVLELPDTSNYHCRVFRYQPGHSIVILAVTRRDVTSTVKFPDYFLILDSVRYYEGPMRWTGINISKGTLNEYLKLYFKVTEQENLTEKEIEEFENDPGFSGELLVIPTQYFTIKIIASHIFFTDEPLPPAYSGNVE